MTAVKSIEAWQHRKIRAIARTLGMSEDDLHALADVDSMRDLSAAQADTVIKRLQELQGHDVVPQRKRRNPAPEGRPGMATAAQQRMVLYLMYELEKYSPSDAEYSERLRGIIHKVLGIDVIPHKEFQWMRFDDCNKLIETMKRYVASAKRKAGGMDESH